MPRISHGSTGGRRAAFIAATAMLAAAALWLWLEARAGDAAELAPPFFSLWRTRDIAVAVALAWCAAALLMVGLGRRAVTRFFLVNASLAGLWLVLEGTALAGVVHYRELLSGRALSKVGSSRVPYQSVRGESFEDLTVFWDLERPAVPFHFKTDRYGFRNEPDRAGADIYCLGDSFLVSGLVPQDQLLASRLEARVGHAVMNVALQGLSPQAEQELLLSSELDLRDRLVLHFVFEGNDQVDSRAWRTGSARTSTPWPERSFLFQSLLRLQALSTSRRVHAERNSGWIGEESYGFYWNRRSFEGLEGELEPIASCLTNTRKAVLDAGGSYAVVLIPDKLRVLGPYVRFGPRSELADWRNHLGCLPEYLKDWAARNGVDMLDLTASLRSSTEAGAIPWWPADTHWNAIGNRVAAEAIADWPVVTAWRAQRESATVSAVLAQN